MPKQSPEERRERNRLRSERWRRAHGVGPRKPAQRPWLAEGISRSTWYRRGNRMAKGRCLNFITNEINSETIPVGFTEGRLARAEHFVAELQAELAEAARCQAIAAGIIGEMAAVPLLSISRTD
jgi:hypothetical protein